VVDQSRTATGCKSYWRRFSILNAENLSHLERTKEIGFFAGLVTVFTPQLVHLEANLLADNICRTEVVGLQAEDTGSVL
jgi:hypothetical protein